MSGNRPDPKLTEFPKDFFKLPGGVPSQPAPLHAAQQHKRDCASVEESWQACDCGADQPAGEHQITEDERKAMMRDPWAIVDQPAGEPDALDRYRAEHPLSGEPEVATVSEVKAGLALYENWRGKVEMPDPGVAFLAGYKARLRAAPAPLPAGEPDDAKIIEIFQSFYNADANRLEIGRTIWRAARAAPAAPPREELRKQFEHWYVLHSFGDQLGSRDSALSWSAWVAATDAASAPAGSEGKETEK